MALRILAGLCVFGVGWYAVDKVAPGWLPQIDVASRITIPFRDSGASAIADKEGKDTKDTAVEGAGGGESGSATQGHEAPAGDLGAGSFDYIDVITVAVRAWLRALAILPGHMFDALVSIDLERHLRAALTAVQDVEWVSGVGFDKACLLLSSIPCFVIAAWCCKRGSKNTPSDSDTSPANSGQATPVDWKSKFSMSDMARQKIHSYRHEGGYIYPGGLEATQLSREDAAAAAIQRWARTEFKRRRLQRTSSRSSVDTPPPNSQRWIDRDYGAVFSTVLEDSSVSADALGPPGGQRSSGSERPSEKRPSETKSQSADDAESRPDIRCRKGLSLSSAKLSKAVLRLKSPEVQRSLNLRATAPP
ncbi:uncharacterized protein LOC142558465 [Dermacentor variabilis]|uniref:uncharacterized protein LOC142558465 n=1 Tax=Dermacentor variabilis TaxID=34621 RepID=UPI003F5C13E0